MSTENDSNTSVRPVVGMYSFFSPDPAPLANFWADLMGLPVADGATEDLVMLDLDHEVAAQTWIFERRAADSGPAAPIALDIGSHDENSWAAVADRAEELGAKRVADRDEGGVRWVDMTDPDGNRFRVFAPRPVA